MVTSVKERLMNFIESKGISIREFERECNLSNGYMKSLRHAPKQDKLSAMLSAFPDLNSSWLLTGEGSMIKRSQPVGMAEEVSKDCIQEGNYSGTVVYDIDATCGTDPRDMLFTQENIIGSVNLPGISKNSVIIRANGDSMEPRIFDGNLVVIREIHSWEDIYYGQIYLVLLDEYRMIKYIRKYEEDEENYIILRSENQKYDDIKLHKSKIRKLFLVENVLSVKSQL